jgi:hypothetical protein
MANETAAAAASVVPALTDAQKYLLRDKQLRFVVAQANLNTIQQQAQTSQTAVQTARQDFQTALDTVVAELGIDGTQYQLDLDTLSFVAKPVAPAAVEPPAAG